MAKKTPAAQPESGTAAYRAGPPEIEFAGRRWLINVAQPVSADEAEALLAHPHAAAFDFTFTAAAPGAAASNHSEE